MIRTILEVTCDACGMIQRFEMGSNHGEQLIATTEVGKMLDRHQWQREFPTGPPSQFRNRDICRACNGSMFQ